MEKSTGVGGPKDWLWPDTNAYDHDLKSCLAVTFWPFGIFARTVQRLGAIEQGQDAENVPEPGLFNRDCSLCLLFLPCFGCWVGGVQTQVRSLYGIEGNGALDVCFSTACPCVSLVRSEQEILLRESKRKRLTACHHRVQLTSNEYQRQDSMSYLSSESAKVKPISKEETFSLGTTAVQGPSKPSLDDHEVTVTGKMTSPRQLDADATILSPAKTTKVSGHHICHDPVATLASRAVPHDLSADKARYFAKLDHDQNLSRDLLAGSGSGNKMPHGVAAREASDGHTTRPSHQVTDDQNKASRSSL
ncbi:hypothetical protein E4U44_008287 [Claviceps purpurea]|nr:hypothetical protein E4U51_006424 [Claviceps purpurea]KAG6227563.1 hypothetical protein E4U26_001604 [Claviceps purpurea]KAG6317991.1 hypothetical protein E4U44_008287 [Claviceps purpurea]